VAATLASCGGGGSNSDPIAFTAAMLNASPTYYTTAPGDPDGTVQETIVFAGSGPYVVTVTTEYFDAGGTLVSTDSFTADVTLNPDGSLTAIELTGTSTLTLTGSTASYLEVTFDDGTDTWSDRWYKSQPAGWLGVPGVMFTAAMLNANLTYYTTFTEGTETVQETIAVSGSGPYVATITDSYFDTSNTFVGSTTIPIDLTLNPDGTLTATFGGDPANFSTLTLEAVTASYLDVSGVDSDTTTWNDRWFLAQPAGWLPATYAISWQMLRHQVSPTQNLYRAYIALNQSGLDITALDWSSVAVANSVGLVTPASPPSFYTASYIAGDCTTTPCTWAPSSESGVFVNFSALSPDYYAFDLIMADNSELLTVIPFFDDITLPMVDSATMGASWVAGDLQLNWTNPTTAADWDRVTQLKIAINSSATGLGTELAYIVVPPSASSVVIPAAMIADMGGTVAGWQVQTRTYTGMPANSQIARGYSNFIALP